VWWCKMIRLDKSPPAFEKWHHARARRSADVGKASWRSSHEWGGQVIGQAVQSQASRRAGSLLRSTTCAFLPDIRLHVLMMMVMMGGGEDGEDVGGRVCDEMK
jgi:hypothetical protein